MLAEQDKIAIIQTASAYGARLVLLFGSSAGDQSQARDIDIAVEGIPPGTFFKFYGDLIMKVTKPLDIVDLSSDNSFTRIIRQEGVLLYDGSEAAS